MKTKSTRTYFQKIDLLLSKDKYLFLAVCFFSFVNYLIFFNQPTHWLTTYLYAVPVSVILGYFTVWFYFSSRKYGLVDTTVFIIFFPYFACYALIPYISLSEKKPFKAKADYESLAASFAYALDEKINEVYAGKVTECLVDKDSIYVTFEAPFGIKIPKQEIIHQLAPSFHIREPNITFSELSNKKTQFIITSKGLGDFDEYIKHKLSWNSFPDLRDRVLLRTPVGTSTQTQPAEKL